MREDDHTSGSAAIGTSAATRRPEAATRWSLAVWAAVEGTPLPPVLCTGRGAAALLAHERVLGVGPCWDAVRLGEAVAVDDLRSPATTARWPMLATWAGTTSVRSCLVVPVVSSGRSIGAVTVAGAVATSAPLSRTFLARSGAAVLSSMAISHTATLVSETCQAAGLLAARHGVDVASGEALLRAQAFVSDLDLDDAAARVLADHAATPLRSETGHPRFMEG